MRRAISNTKKLVAGQTSPEDLLGDNNYPASASYVDVSGYETVDIIIHMGLIHDDDTPTFQVKCADAADGTLDVISATYCVHACATDDDDEFVTFHLETSQLPADHHFLSVVCTLATNGSYADIVYYLGGARHLPVTQTTALLPAASQHIYAG